MTANSNRVSVYGGSMGHTLDGCELADHGEAFASREAARNLVNLSTTAMEAFAPQEERVQLGLYHGLTLRQVGFSTPMQLSERSRSFRHTALLATLEPRFGSRSQSHVLCSCLLGWFDS